jgi:hypothetical protein
MKEIFQTCDYCLKELLNCRKLMTNKNTFNKETAFQLGKTLSAMYLYCPETIKDQVYAVLTELTTRELMEEIYD